MTSPILPPVGESPADVAHLRLLSVFHFVGAGLGLLGLGILVLQYVFFGSVMANPEVWENGSGDGPPPEQFVAFMQFFIVLIGFLVLATMVGNLLSAIYLRRRRHRVFSLVIAGINCLQFPLGTALGIFTFIVLLRDSVRALYQQAAGPRL